MLAKVLRERGHDVVAAADVGHVAWTDPDHFRFAIETGRVLVSHNIRDFVPIARATLQEGGSFPGLLVGEQLPFGALLRRVLRFLTRVDEDAARDRVLWLTDYE